MGASAQVSGQKRLTFGVIYQLPLSDQQRSEVERLVEQMRLLRENNERVLTLAKELSTGTIDKVMAKSDVELGLEMLMKGWSKR